MGEPKTQFMNRFRALLLLFLFVLTGNIVVAQTEFQKSLVVPLAYGEVEVEEVEREEFLVKLDVEYLTEPDNLSDRTKHYVVWAESRKDTSRLGVLNFQEEEMTGHFITEVTLEDDPEFILISAEPNENSEEISDIVVLRSEELERF